MVLKDANESNSGYRIAERAAYRTGLRRFSAQSETVTCGRMFTRKEVRDLQGKRRFTKV